VKRFVPLLFFGILLVGVPKTYAQPAAYHGGIKTDWDVLKDPTYWRARAPMVPLLTWGLGMGFTPNYYSPANAEVSPYLGSSLKLGLGMSLRQFGVSGYWGDLGLRVGWGLTKGLTDNMDFLSRDARQVYSTDVGLSLGKGLFVERNTGIRLRAGLSFKIPTSLSSWQRTLITSIGPRLSLSKSFLSRIHLRYSFGVNFNFYVQDSGVYHPNLAGIPRLNKSWGMNHSFGLGFTIIRNLSLSFGLGIGVGYSFADTYTSPDGPQVYGSENLSAAQLASYPLNEGNSYSISIGLGYKFNKHLRISLGYSNRGRQFEYQYDANGNVQYVVRNPFKLQNGSFGLGLSGMI
jgi:hypothetical protein